MTLLADIAYIRSGDKGDNVTIGVIARSPDMYPVLLQALSVDRMKKLFADWVQGDIDVYPMDNIEAAVVVLRRGLGGGATTTLRLDQTGKSLGNALLRLPVDLD